MKRSAILVGLALSLALVVGGTTVHAEVTRVEVLSRSEVFGGKSFGAVGPYEEIIARVYFAVAPENIYNQAIVDLDLAPRNDQGRVEFSADVHILRPSDPGRGNGTLLLDIPNRGGRPLLGLLRGTELPGDGLFMRLGFTIAWVGWQFDVEERIGLQVPVATLGNDAITGLVRTTVVPTSSQFSASLPPAYPAIDLEGEGHAMTVRDALLDTPTRLPRTAWSYGRREGDRLVKDPTQVYLHQGFEANRIYEIIYRSSNPPLAGLGFAAVRDLVAYAKHTSNGLLTVQHAISIGFSQSGRFLRDFLYQGFNADESGRMVFDGLIPAIAGGGRSYTNYRFAQPGLAGGLAPRWHFIPVDQFPFTDLNQTDPVTDQTDGLLRRSRALGVVPRVFYVNTTGEYYNRAASLIHTTVDGRRDMELPDHIRLYVVAGSPHGGGLESDPQPSPNRRYYSNPNSKGWVIRALVPAMQSWIAEGQEPPPSSYPRIGDGSLVPLEALQFPRISGVTVPQQAYTAYRFDFGPKSREGILNQLPPVLGEPYTLLVPQVDQDGNELAGIRMPELAVPLATYTGWNVKKEPQGRLPDLAILAGSFIPFPQTAEDRTRIGDPRRAIEERYPSREAYVGLYAEAARRLVDEGYLLAEDFPSLLDLASRRWDFLAGNPDYVPK